MKEVRCIKDRFHVRNENVEARIVRSNDPCWGGDERKFLDWCNEHGAVDSEIYCEVIFDDKSFEFYKEFYDKNYSRILQYENLRKHFKKMVDRVLGKDYYNIGNDVYECDEISCDDITEKSRFWLWPRKRRK